MKVSPSKVVQWAVLTSLWKEKKGGKGKGKVFNEKIKQNCIKYKSKCRDQRLYSGQC